MSFVVYLCSFIDLCNSLHLFIYLFIYLFKFCSDFHDFLPSTNIGVLCCSFSGCFRCKVRLLIRCFACFLTQAYIAMNFPLSIAFTASHKFWVVLFTLSFVAMHIFISVLLFPVICWLFRSVFFSPHTCLCFFIIGFSSYTPSFPQLTFTLRAL